MWATFLVCRSSRWRARSACAGSSRTEIPAVVTSATNSGRNRLSLQAFRDGAFLPFSMTGFGAAEGGVGGGVLRIELRSVNHRYLHVTLKAPTDLAQLEADFRDRLRRDFERGHV